MPVDRNGGRTAAAAASLALVAALAGCGGGKHQAPPELVLGDQLSTETVAFADGAGLRLPLRLDGFERTGLVSEPRASGATATYASERTTVTIRVRRVGEGRTLFTSPDSVATTNHSAAALSRAVAAVRREEPSLAEGPSSDLYLVRFGAIQAGRTASLSGAGVPMTIDAFCCVNGIWSYVFTVDGPDSDAGARFVRDLAWSASESASLEVPQ